MTCLTTLPSEALDIDEKFLLGERWLSNKPNTISHGTKETKKQSTNQSVEVVAALRIFLRMFLKKYKLYNLIKRKIHILTTITIKKTRNI